MGCMVVMAYVCVCVVWSTDDLTHSPAVVHENKKLLIQGTCFGEREWRRKLHLGLGREQWGEWHGLRGLKPKQRRKKELR